jgi:hypothetical protein
VYFEQFGEYSSGNNTCWASGCGVKTRAPKQQTRVLIVATRTSKSRKPKPLATLSGPFTAKIHRSKFKPFESTKYLDVKALKKAGKVSVEIAVR